MSNREHNQHLEKLRSLSKKILKSKESASAFLVSAGIHTKNGNLTKHYTTPFLPKQPLKNK